MNKRNLQPLLIPATECKWSGGLPLPNGYEVLDKNGNRLALYFSEGQALIHLSLATILRSAVGKKPSDFQPKIAEVISEYLEIKDGLFYSDLV